jgi:uncharacterized protein YdhG (YjbR/CyaY superfamily)
MAVNLKQSKKQFETIDEYIATFPTDVKRILKELRQAIRDSAPNAEEAISYQIPTFKLNGILVHFQHSKTILDFTPLHPQSTNSKRN